MEPRNDERVGPFAAWHVVISVGLHRHGFIVPTLNTPEIGAPNAHSGVF